MPKNKSYEDIAVQVNDVSRRLVERAAGMQDALAQTNTLGNKITAAYDPLTDTGKLTMHKLNGAEYSHTDITHSPELSEVYQAGAKVVDLANQKVETTDALINASPILTDVSGAIATLQKGMSPAEVSTQAAGIARDLRSELVQRSVAAKPLAANQ